MTIGNALLILLPFAIALSAAFGYYIYVKSDAFRLKRYDYWSAQFYSAAKRLTQNPDTPNSTIDLLENLNGMIVSKRSPMAIYEVFYSKISKDKPKATDVGRESDLKLFLKKNPEMGTIFKTAIHSGILAASYSSNVGGSLARSVLADVFCEINTRELEPATASVVSEVTERMARGSSLVPLIMAR